jgi:hypothetical protein
MGGQDTLLLVARRPDWLAGAAALDSPCDMILRYHDFPALPNGRELQREARVEFGGTPEEVPQSYRERSPLYHARQLAGTWIRLLIWWSVNDEKVIHQARHSKLLYERIKQLNPQAPVFAKEGTWRHSAEMRADRLLPEVLTDLGLL